MSEYLIKEETLTNIADEIRELSGSTSGMTPNNMITNLDEANDEVITQKDLINTIKTALEGKANPSPAEPINLQSKTVNPTTSKQVVSPDSGYNGLSKVTVNAIPTTTLATPNINIGDGACRAWRGSVASR